MRHMLSTDTFSLFRIQSLRYLAFLGHTVRPKDRRSSLAVVAGQPHVQRVLPRHALVFFCLRAPFASASPSSCSSSRAGSELAFRFLSWLQAYTHHGKCRRWVSHTSQQETCHIGRQVRSHLLAFFSLPLFADSLGCSPAKVLQSMPRQQRPHGQRGWMEEGHAHVRPCVACVVLTRRR